MRDIKIRSTGVSRRTFLESAAITMASASLAISTGSHAEFGPPPHRPEASGTPNVPSGFNTGVRQVQAGVLDIGYIDEGPREGPVVILLHGWPYDIHSFAEVTPLLTATGRRVIVPYLRGYGTTRFLTADAMRNGQQSAFALDVIALMDALRIREATVAGFDWGARTAGILAALWPDRCKALVSVSGYLIGNQGVGQIPLPPSAEWKWWYQFYFATDRGRDGYERYRRDFNRQIWTLASPQWRFSDALFAQSAASFDNPDHVAIVVHNYRWRLNLAHGEPAYDRYEQKLAAGPVISIPTITMEGDANGAPHPDSSSYRAKFSGRYEHRVARGGIGHNLPQEAPAAFARAVLDVTALS